MIFWSYPPFRLNSVRTTGPWKLHLAFLEHPLGFQNIVLEKFSNGEKMTAIAHEYFENKIAYRKPKKRHGLFSHAVSIKFFFIMADEVIPYWDR